MVAPSQGEVDLESLTNAAGLPSSLNGIGGNGPSSSENIAKTDTDSVDKDDPLKILLQPNANPGDAALANGSATPEVEISRDVPEELRKFAGVFDPGAMSFLPETKILAPNEVDGGEAAAEQVDATSLYHPDPVPLPVWEEVKHTPIPSLKIPNLSLLEVLGTLESIFGVPCDWDVNAVSFVAIEWDRTITKQYQQVTLEHVYLDILAEYGLTLNAQPNDLPISFQRVYLHQRRSNQSI